MIILRQKSYSWDEIKRAAKSIGKGALIGAGSGAFLGRKQLTEKDNPKGFLLGTGIGAAVGAGIGTAAYINGYKERKAIEKEEPHKKEVDSMIEKKFPWAIKYLEDIDKKIEKENKKIDELSEKLFKESSYFLDDVVALPTISNEYSYLSDFVADLGINPDIMITPKSDKGLIYNESTGNLEITESGKSLCSIKNKSQLQNALRKYYFNEIITGIKDIMNDYVKYGLSYEDYKPSRFMKIEEMGKDEYYKALDIYFKEIENFYKTL